MSIEETIKLIGPLDESAMQLARERQDMLTKPRGSLGKLEALSIQIAGIKGTARPEIRNKCIVTMAADHGVVKEKVTLYPQEVTRQMVLNFIKGGAAINVLARQIGARVTVVNMGMAGDFVYNSGIVNKTIDFGTANIARGPAMTRQQAIHSIESGMDVVNIEIRKGLDIIGTGDMGIGNTTASSAIFAAISNITVSLITGRGAGIDDKQLKHKISVIQQALDINKPDANDPLDVLAKVGGFEIGGLAGLILQAAACRIPVVVDGFISSVSALIALKMAPRAKDYLIAAHASSESGHARLLQYMGLEPLLNLDMRLGEGTGAVLGISLAEAAVNTLNQMATFDEAGVSDKN